jgi:hypothetical protein
MHETSTTPNEQDDPHNFFEMLRSSPPAHPALLSPQRNDDQTEGAKRNQRQAGK